jgi:glycosyltransferase involved in cell wall biosynthesis
MKLSYLITCHDETITLDNLLSRLDGFIGDTNDQIVIIADNPTKETSDILYNWSTIPKIFVFEHNLNNNYSDHKNWGASKCSGDFLFQIDGDEIPTVSLLENVKNIIEINPTIEAFWIPRINDFKGVTNEHAKQWGWRLTESPTYKRPIVNFPDFQCRLFRNVPDRIKWVGRLHERIEGNYNYAFLPPDEELSLYHDKTIEKQIETNLRYNRDFTQKENQGFNLPK